MNRLLRRTEVNVLFDEPEPAQPPIDWSLFWFWLGLIVFGMAELLFATYGFYHALVKFGHLLERLLP